MSAPLLVVGAGAAGTAAAVTFARAGARVRVIHAAAGATQLWNGIVDGLAGELGADERALLAALGVRCPQLRPRIVTALGTSREAHGHDSELLDLEATQPKLVLVPSLGRPAWDAKAIASSLANAHAGSFEARVVSVPKLLAQEEIALSDGALARRMDDPARAATFEAALAAALDRWRNTSTALLLPPWLGVERPLAERLSRTLALAVGECATTLAGAAGMRFVVRRDALFEEAGVEIVRGRVASLDVHASGARVRLEGGEEHEGVGVVVACGGLVAGGVAIPRAVVAVEPRVIDRASPSIGFEAPALRVGAHGRPWPMAGSRYGTSTDELLHGARGRGTIDAIGVLADADGATAQGGPVRVAGDLVADGQRTFGAALRGGIRAARSLLRP